MSSTTEMLRNAVGVLNQQNYQVYLTAQPELELCFELIAEHLTRTAPSLVIKIIENIDSIKPQFIHELKLIAGLLAAVPLLLANENRRAKLEDNVIYSRENLIAINYQTFSNVMKTPKLPLAIAKQGGFFIDIDGKKLQELRERHNLSRQDLADRLQITTKAVSQYEKNEMRTSMEHAKLFHEIFGESVILPQNFFETVKTNPKATILDESLQRRMTAKHRDFMNEVTEYVNDAGYKVFWTRNAPFDVIIYQEVDSKPNLQDCILVGGAHSEKQYQENQKYSIQIQFLQRVNKPGALILDEEIIGDRIPKEDSVPYMIPRELKLLENPKEFQNFIRKRFEKRF